MRRLLLWVILPAAVGAFFFIGRAPPPPLAKLGENAVIVAFGDSLTAGTGAAVGYPQHLSDLTGRTVINAGIRGETSGAALARLPGVLKNHKPNLLIVCTGGNDFLRRLPAAETEKNLRAIVETARAAKVPLVLIAVPRLLPLPLNHPLYDKIAGEKNLWLEDEILKTVLHDNRLKSDHVHPNAAGYLLLAEAVAALLRRAGAVK